MRTIVATLAALITLLVPACELYTDEPHAIDAGPTDACYCDPSWPTCPAGCEPRAYCTSGFVPDRVWECQVLCTEGIGVCEGAEVIDCRRQCEARMAR